MGCPYKKDIKVLEDIRDMMHTLHCCINTEKRCQKIKDGLSDQIGTLILEKIKYDWKKGRGESLPKCKCKMPPQRSRFQEGTDLKQDVMGVYAEWTKRQKEKEEINRLEKKLAERYYQV